MKKIPKFTIIIPCKNAENTIQRSLDSIRVQNYPNLECILMDGNSIDNTMSIVKKNSDILSLVISEDDASAPEAVNKAIQLSTGDIVGFLMADDYLVDNFFNILSEVVMHNPDYDLYSYGVSIEVLNTKKVIFESFSKKDITLKLDNILFKHTLHHFYRKNIFKKYGLLKELFYDGSVFISNDKEFLIRLCLNNVKNYVIEKIIYKMTAHKNSMTLSRKYLVKIREEHIAIADYYIHNYELSTYQKKRLIDFKSHNLSLLLVYYFYKLDIKNIKKIYLEGFSVKSFFWFFDIIKCPLSEIIYRAKLKKF